MPGSVASSASSSSSGPPDPARGVDLLDGERGHVPHGRGEQAARPGTAGDHPDPRSVGGAVGQWMAAAAHQPLQPTAVDLGVEPDAGPTGRVVEPQPDAAPPGLVVGDGDGPGDTQVADPAQHVHRGPAGDRCAQRDRGTDGDPVADRVEQPAGALGAEPVEDHRRGRGSEPLDRERDRPHGQRRCDDTPVIRSRRPDTSCPDPPPPPPPRRGSTGTRPAAGRSRRPPRRADRSRRSGTGPSVAR